MAIGLVLVVFMLLWSSQGGPWGDRASATLGGLQGGTNLKDMTFDGFKGVFPLFTYK